jgi:hypothetical protein
MRGDSTIRVRSNQLSHNRSERVIVAYSHNDCWLPFISPTFSGIGMKLSYSYGIQLVKSFG